jgi:hypothetical protein
MIISSLIAGPYVWQSNPIYSPPAHTDFIWYRSPLSGVEVDGNGHVWTSTYSNSYFQDQLILIYDPVSEIIDTIGPEIDGITGPDTINHSRGFAKLGDGNIAFADYTNDKIRIFDADDHSIIKESPSTDLNCSGGIGAFVFDNNQYFLSQQIIGSTIVIWDSDFNVVDTLTGGPGGRNLACTYDGNKIISPSLGGQYFVEWTGNPDDGYITDTIWLSELSVPIGNIMYVSSGPNDYFWLMSRDAQNDGILVVDPLFDYEVRLFTNTDSSVTHNNGFDLGMITDNQVAIWLATGVIDSSEVDSILNTCTLRAPCAVACDFDGFTEYLYIADFYGYMIKYFTRTLTYIGISETVLNDDGFVLYGAYPNPLNPTTTINYEIREASNARLDIYNISGQFVETLADKYHLAGAYKVKWDASKYSSGIYIYRLKVGDKHISRKMLLIK